jgi:hypothetical protein
VDFEFEAIGFELPEINFRIQSLEPRARVGNPPHFVVALSGDVGSAAMLLRLREHGIKYGDNGPLIINILNSRGPRPMDRVQTFFKRPIAPKIAADTRGSQDCGSPPIDR